ncbi:hypothetical protein C8J56DRAFT_1055328 [Mycena floridula]|nr:hypothetical protein C8J56DRAFT_1055328 [Mycena floridula]
MSHRMKKFMESKKRREKRVSLQSHASSGSAAVVPFTPPRRSSLYLYDPTYDSGIEEAPLEPSLITKVIHKMPRMPDSPFKNRLEEFIFLREQESEHKRTIRQLFKMCCEVFRLNNELDRTKENLLGAERELGTMSQELDVRKMVQSRCSALFEEIKAQLLKLEAQIPSDEETIFDPVGNSM